MKRERERERRRKSTKDAIPLASLPMWVLNAGWAMGAMCYLCRLLLVVSLGKGKNSAQIADFDDSYDTLGRTPLANSEERNKNGA